VLQAWAKVHVNQLIHSFGCATPASAFVLQAIEARRPLIGQFCALQIPVAGEGGQLGRSDGEFRVFLGFAVLNAGQPDLAQLLIMLKRASQGLPGRVTEATGRVRSQGL
jgi:hypothetical protein